jgi:malate dehydrogenase (quinone)
MNTETKYCDVILVGAGIMSATLGTMLQKLEPSWSIQIFERMDRVTAESSDAWNNAGTGHSAFCELNYTPQKEDGTIDITKAIKIAEAFERSKEYWAYLASQGILSTTKPAIRKVPHISFVWGNKDVEFLQKRYEAMRLHPFFESMHYTTDSVEMKTWMPLVVEGRYNTIPLAATKMDIGTDVNFGDLTRAMFDYLDNANNVSLHLSSEVEDIAKDEQGLWNIEVKNLETDITTKYKSKFVFIGAGGGSLSLLEKSDIEEGRGYGGFPISGQWLVCTNPDIIEKHAVKVYGKAKVGSPPMSVPHLDTRMIDGKKALLFGPFAGFSTKFLKNGSYLDLPLSVKWDNLKPLLSAGIKNIPLTKYLIEQVTQSDEDRYEALLEYLPNAKKEDWELQQAGQRVQVIKKDDKEGGILEFGTEVVFSKDGSIATLLGASPGASTAVSIMLDLLEKCFPTQIKTEKWQDILKSLVPSYGIELSKDFQLCKTTRERTAKMLGLV